MKAIKELGAKEILKHFFFTFWQVIFDCLPFSPARVFWLRLFGARIGKDTVIDKIDFINFHKKGLRGLFIGKECFLGRGVFLDLTGEIILEDQVSLAPQVMILTHLSVGYQNHPLMKTFPKMKDKVIIKKGSFIGARSTILAGTTIGRKSFVGAVSLVKGEIPDKVLVAGVPAKIIRKIK